MVGRDDLGATVGVHRVPGRRGRHARPAPLVRRLALPALLTVAVAGGGAVMVWPHPASAALAVSDMTVDSELPAIGTPVTATAQVTAARTRTVETVAIAVRDPAGARADFPDVAGWSVGSSPRDYRGTRTFTEPGVYTYWFTYRDGGQWRAASAEQTFIVTDPDAPASSAASAVPTPSGTPMPAGTGTAGGGTATAPRGSTAKAGTSSTPAAAGSAPPSRSTASSSPSPSPSPKPSSPTPSPSTPPSGTAVPNSSTPTASPASQPTASPVGASSAAA